MERTTADGKIPAQTILDGLKAGRTRWQLLDVRAPKHYREGHVAGAQNLPLGKVGRAPSLFKPTDPLAMYSYDEDCLQASRAAKALSDQGFNARAVQGGYEALKEGGAPIREGDDA